MRLISLHSLPPTLSSHHPSRILHHHLQLHLDSSFIFKRVFQKSGFSATDKGGGYVVVIISLLSWTLTLQNQHVEVSFNKSSDLILSWPFPFQIIRL